MPIAACPFPPIMSRRAHLLLRSTIWLLCVTTLFLCVPQGAEAHGIAGNRLFVGTLSFDDPAVNDEFSSTFSDLRHAVPGGAAVDKTLSAGFSRLLTPGLALAADSAWTSRGGRGVPNTNGFETTHLSLKGRLYEDDPHELLLSAGFGWGLPGVGRRRLGAHGSVEPGIFFGKGFGDLPDSVGALRPIAIAGALSVEHPSGRRTIPDIVHWSAALEFSTLYLTDRFTGGPPKEEPLFQWVPLIEFAAATPTRGKTSAWASPGIAYVADQYQVAAEVIVPLNRHAGGNVGAMVKLLLFLDDLVPSVFGRPLIGE